MLTRLKVDGFKNLIGFDCHFGPYTCIAGPNAVGKSNIFDAIEFLSLLADNSFLQAAQLLRGNSERAIDPKTLFWNNADSTSPVMRFEAEMIVPNVVEDDFGREGISPSTTFLRYELELRYSPPEEAGSYSGEIRLQKEGLTHIRKSDAHRNLPWPHSAKDFRNKIVVGRRSGAAYISTEIHDGEAVVNVHQDGGSRGKPRPSPASRAPRTIVSTVTQADDQTILAARREMQQWRMLALEPTAMRSPDGISDDPHVSENGAHLAAALFRLSTKEGDSIYREIVADASALTDIRALRVSVDERRDILTLEARLGSSPWLPARSLSDGTLRFLALCVMRADPEASGLLCMEEPENGIHPGRIVDMVDLVRSLAVDPFENPGPDNPMRQVMVNTHSPHFVQYQKSDDLLAASPATVSHEGSMVRTVRLSPMPGSWREKAGQKAIHKQSLVDYLEQPEESLFSLRHE